MKYHVSEVTKVLLRSDWRRCSSAMRAHIRMLNPRGANDLDGVITVSPGGVAIVPEIWCTR